MSQPNQVVLTALRLRDTARRVLRVNWAGRSMLALASVYGAWASVGLAALVSATVLIRDWPAAAEELGPEQGLFETLLTYPIGGRLLVTLLFLGLFGFFGLTTRARFFVGAGLFNLAWVLDVDKWVLEFLESYDPLEGVRSAAEAEEMLSAILIGFLGWFALVALLASLLFTGVLRDFGNWFIMSAKRRRVSELFLWVILLAPALLYTIAWVAFQLSGDVFTDLGVYPVLGRLVVWVSLLIVGTVAIGSRPLLLSLGLASYATQLFDVDGLLLDQADNPRDEFFGELYAFGPSLDSFFVVQSWLSFFLPVLLAWTLIISIAGLVRRRTRARLEAWIDSRRIAVYGAEDIEGDAPRRVSVLAVLSLAFAILVPVLGLILAYAARNDFVASRPRKSGLDLAVAGTIIGWFGLGFQLFIVILTIVGSFLGGSGPFDLLLLGIGTFFGLDVLDPFSSIFGDVFGGLADLSG